MSTIPPITAPTVPATTPASTPDTTAVKDPTLLDRDAFLKLLVAQLRYQDPNKPMDASAMISQSAQLSVVDKLDEISSLLDRSASSDKLTLAGSVLGRQISFPGPDGATIAATVRSVRFEETGLVLSTGDWEVPMEAVTAIGTASPVPVPAVPAPADA